MNKYGIISLNVYQKDNNWGSLLQSYALQEVIKSLGVEVKIINICPRFINRFEAKYPIVRVLPFNVRLLKHSFRNSVINFNTYIKRGRKFEQFIDKYYDKTQRLAISDLETQGFSGFVVGSDIVWDIDFTDGFDSLYFCDYPFMKKTKNIAYAPSMCDRMLDTNEEQLFCEKLQNFSNVSLREKSYVEYVQQFTDKSVVDVIDPTLLLNADDYKSLIYPRMIPERYVLVYTVPEDEPLSDYAYEYALKKGFKLVKIECLNIRKRNKDYIYYNDAGVEEWLSLIKHSERVFTNSFHACIFSILFKKQFNVVYRSPGKTKIEDLCSVYKIENYEEKQEKYSFNTDQSINYDIVYEILEIKRKESKEYLQSALLNKNL